jgi:NAD(P)-dependent dehydrogenase (short-subunit alcohol dehydrogenase family)
MTEFKGKVALVTGAARGMGAATAQLFAAHGAVVVLADVLDGSLVVEDIARQGGKALYIPCDVKDEAQVAAAMQQTRDAHGRLDVLVNVAGINRKYRLEEMPVEEWDIMMAINVRGMFLTIKHAVPLLRESGGGSIVNMSSVSALIGAVDYAAYHTTKGAVLSLTRAAAQELAPDNIRVNAICPGWVDTPFTDEALAKTDDPDRIRASAKDFHMLGRMAQPEEIAQAALFLASDQASFITAESLFVDGGFMAKR